MSNPSMYYSHLVQLVAGPIEPHNLQIGLAPNTSETWNAGALCSQTALFKAVKGCADTAMPLWAINGTSDLDVKVEGSDYGGGVGIGSGNVNFYVGTGGYELYTTEYDSATANSYVGNAMLAPATGANAGKMQAAAAAYSLHLVCGYVSRGVKANEYGISVLYFWPVCIPPVST